MPDLELARAKTVADRILRNAGVQPEWFACTPDQFKAGECVVAEYRGAIQMHVLPSAEAGRWPVERDTFGVALPSPRFGFYAGVFYDRVRQLGAETGVSTATVFGHVLAHEIGHLLLPAHSHSVGGVMKERWLKRELDRMQQGTLLFHAEEARKIRSSVASRLRD